ncbi:MAG: 6-pyruvoyl trahydropterin synthase family protein [Gammaproteobacteria bacterium]
MYELAITRDFIAQHFLVGGDWGKENQRHSHHYRVEVRIEAAELDQHGYLLDIVDLETALAKILASFGDKTLNELEEFRNLNPSLERFARVIFNALLDELDFEAEQLSVKLWENDTDWASYRASPGPRTAP